MTQPIVGSVWAGCCGFWTTEAGFQAHICGFNETPCPHCGPSVVDQGTGYGHRADCPTFTEPHAIVRELAERGPYATLKPSGWYVCPQIGCHKQAHIDHDWFKNPANHDPRCLWRRAREWRAATDRNV